MNRGKGEINDTEEIVLVATLSSSSGGQMSGSHSRNLELLRKMTYEKLELL